MRVSLALSRHLLLVPYFILAACSNIIAVNAGMELHGMSRQARLNCAEKQLAVGTGSGDRPACTDASIHN